VDDRKRSSPAVTLRVFLDRSILEVYCGGAALTNRTFSDPESLGIDLFAEGGAARLRSLDVWKMQSMWRHVPTEEQRPQTGLQ
jgi:sucrose-6-phosphate hydrolase SacC (GH32 family)